MNIIITGATGEIGEEEEWIRIFKGVFLNPLLLLKEAIQRMNEEFHNKVVIISGISSIQVMSRYSINSAIRSAWLAQAKTISINLSHVHVNTLSLGGIKTKGYNHRLKLRAESEDKCHTQLYQEDVSNVPLKKYASG